MEQPNGQGRENWGSRVGVILAVMGSAVGLGNFLRFPGVAAQNGGGAFMIPYVCAFLLLGLPIAWAEWTMGRRGGALGYNSPPGIFRAILGRNAGAYAGTLAVVMPVMIYMYYVFVEGWCFAYAFKYLTGQMADVKDYNVFFHDFVGINKDGSAINGLDQGFSAFFNSAVFFMGVCFIVNFFLIYRGLTKGIEWFCKWAMPALIFCALIILVRVLTLPAVVEDGSTRTIVTGLGYMWNPVKGDTSIWDTLSRSEVWLAAAGQIFFSLSVAFGLIVTYASYVKKDDDIALSSLTAVAGNGFCEVVLGGLMIVPAAFLFLGMGFVENPPGTFGMGFVALPSVFQQMPMGQFFGFVFFFLLFLAAVTSSLSMLQPAIALLEEGLGLKRKASVTMLGFITAVGSAFVAYFSKDLMALDTIDFWIANVCIFLMALVQVVIFGWILNIGDGIKELKRGAEIPIPRVLPFVLKYITPVYLVIVFGLWIYQQFINVKPGETSRLAQIIEIPVVRYSLLFITFVSIFFTLLVSQSVKRWERLEREADIKDIDLEA